MPTSHTAGHPGHLSTLARTDPEFIEIFDNVAFDEVLSYGLLDARTRLMTQLAAIIACQALSVFRTLAVAALDIGVSPVEMKEIVYQAVPYVGLGFVPFSPLGKGFLTGTVSATTEFSAGDVRNTIPRFAADNVTANQVLLDHVQALASATECTPGQIALAWLLAQQPWIVPIPGTRRRGRIDENTGATAVPLSADEVATLDALAAAVGVQGDRYNPAGMAMVGL